MISENRGFPTGGVLLPVYAGMFNLDMCSSRAKDMAASVLFDSSFGGNCDLVSPI